jgi:sugar transferase (PEP-CTERM/EpsH1 system associated)
MRLLFITSRLPYPPNRGDRLRVFNFIRSLSKDHEIHLLSFISSEAESQHIGPLKEYCQQIDTVTMSAAQSTFAVIKNIWRKFPLQALYYRSDDMRDLIDRTLTENSFDAVYVHLFRMAPYLENHEDIYRIVDLTDVISQEIIHSIPYRGLISRLIYSFECPRIERYECWIARHFEETWLISDYDFSVLAANCPGANIKVVRNGVDTNVFFPTNQPEIPNNIILVGHMGVFHNIDAATFLAKEILPKVRAMIPDVNLKIVGAAPNSRVRALESIPGVEVTGFISDLNAALNQAVVFVAPLRFSAGVQNKVLEALAAGKPVITTSLVNAGLGAIPGRDLLIADGAQETTNAIFNLLRNENLRKNLGQSARKFVLQHYRWDLVRTHISKIVLS